MADALTGKVAIITGAARGIGRQLAEDLAAAGAKVALNYSSSQAQAEEAVAAIRASGGEALAIQADISRLSEIERLFLETLSTYGQVDILVNNAGIMFAKPIEQMTEADFDRQFSINVKGTYFACQQAAMHMNAGGRIINLSTSVVGAMFPGYSIYAGTKGAVEQFTRQLAKELGPKGITINAVAPGPIATELFLAEKTEEQINMQVRSNSFNRLGQPNDISPVVLFLASESSRWITGQTIRVNGGYV